MKKAIPGKTKEISRQEAIALGVYVAENCLTLVPGGGLVQPINSLNGDKSFFLFSRSEASGYLLSQVRLSPLLRLLDVFDFAYSQKKILTPLLGPFFLDYCKEGMIKIKVGADDNLAYLELYRNLLIKEDVSWQALSKTAIDRPAQPQMIESLTGLDRIGIHGVCLLSGEDAKNKTAIIGEDGLPRELFSISLSETAMLSAMPLRLSTVVEMNAQGGDATPIKKFRAPSQVCLLDLLTAIFSELSLYGSPASKQAILHKAPHVLHKSSNQKGLAGVK